MKYHIKVIQYEETPGEISYTAEAYLDERFIELASGRTAKEAEERLINKLKSKDSERVIKEMDIDLETEF
jgi:hypothetical protein